MTQTSTPQTSAPEGLYRRRARRRPLIPGEPGERTEFLNDLAIRIVPAVDFFLYTLIAGVVLAIAFLLDSPAVFVLAVVLAPFMSPVAGIALAAVAGSLRFLLRSLAFAGVSSLAIFLFGLLAGWVAGMQPGFESTQAGVHAHFTWHDLAVLSIAAGIMTYLMVRHPQQKPRWISTVVAYEVFLPLGSAGFLLASGMPGVWLDGLALFGIHLIWAALVSAILLVVMGFRPFGCLGYVLTSGLALLVVVIVALMGWLALQSRVPAGIDPATPTATPTLPATPSHTPLPPSVTPSFTHTNTAIVTSTITTPTGTRTLVATPTLTITPTFAPTPIWARVSSPEGGGIVIRVEPRYEALIVHSLLNGNLVQILPDTTRIEAGATWVKVRTTDGKEGWVVRSLLSTATPAP